MIIKTSKLSRTLSSYSQVFLENNANPDFNSKKAKKKIFLIMVVCSFFIIVQIIGAYYSNSVAILTDAAHLGSDLIGFFISLYSMYLAEKYNPNRTLGS
jgi:zinc transporter 2